MSTYFDTQTLHIVNQLQNNPSIEILKQFLVEEEYHYDSIMDDMKGPEDESDILEAVGKNLYLKMKSIVLPMSPIPLPIAYIDDCSDIETETLPNISPILESLPNQEYRTILLDFLRNENFDTIDSIKEDIEDEDNSCIFEYLEHQNIGRAFYIGFCDKIRDTIQDEWSVILQRMMRNTTFCNQIYHSVINYFRDNNFTVKDYIEDEYAENYQDSYFHHIVPQMKHHKRKELIKVFEECVINNDDIKDNILYNAEAVPDITDGNVCEYNECVIDRCSEMVQCFDTTQSSNQDADLKALCSILDINAVLELSDILCRQYLVALYHTDEDAMNDLLMDITKNNEVMIMFEEFIQCEFWVKQHNQDKLLLYITHTLRVLSAPRWLGYCTPPISNNELISKLVGNARNVQIYVFAFLISSSRMLIKHFRDTNVSLMLDMKFGEYDRFDDDKIAKGCKLDLESKILAFIELFENNSVRGNVRDKILKERCMIVHSVDFNAAKGTKERWNNLKPKLCGLNKRDIGFELNECEYMQRFDKCELFQICRAKKYLLDQVNEKKRFIGSGTDRISVSLHKFGNTFKLYLYFEQSVFRIRCEDLCEWFPSMFVKNDTALEWKQMRSILSRALRDNEKLLTLSNESESVGGHYYSNDVQNHKYPKKKTNFWKNIVKWSDLDKEFYRKCDKFTYKMKNKFSLKYDGQVFDRNIVDKEAVINLL